MLLDGYDEDLVEVNVSLTIDPRFTRLLEAQRDIQRVFIGDDPGNLPDERKMSFIMETALSLQTEVAEVLQETGWKPWASSNHINHAAFREEMADVFIFFMNLMLTAGMTMRELVDEVTSKQAKNLARQAAGYTGIKEKCPGCGSALDGAGVGCYFVPEDLDSPRAGEAWCNHKKEYVPWA